MQLASTFDGEKKIDAFIIPQLISENDYSIADKTKATEQIAVTVIPPVNTAAVKAEKT
jgi:hypothetical protein